MMLILFVLLGVFARDYKSNIACYYYKKTDGYFGQKNGLTQNYVWAKDDKNNLLSLKGRLFDGFFHVTKSSVPLTYTTLTEVCKKNILLQYGEDYEFANRVTALKSSISSYDYPIFLPENAPKDGVNRIVIFGDSISDTGNLKKWLGYPNAPYWLGRFTDGKNWVDYLPENLPVLNWSYGGSTIQQKSDFSIFKKDEFKSSTDEVKRILITGSVLNYINKYKNTWLNENTPPEIRKNTLFIIWAGVNDYLIKMSTEQTLLFINENYEKIVHRAVNNIIEGIKELAGVGAESFMIFNLADLSIRPWQEIYKEPSEIVKISQEYKLYIAYHNKILKEKLDLLQEDSLYKNIKIVQANSNEYLSELITNMEKYGFEKHDNITNIKFNEKNYTYLKSCYQGEMFQNKSLNDLFKSEKPILCRNPSKHILFEAAHPTSKSFCYLEYFIMEDLKKHNMVKSEEESIEKRIEYCSSLENQSKISEFLNK